MNTGSNPRPHQKQRVRKLSKLVKQSLLGRHYLGDYYGLVVGKGTMMG